MSLMVNRLTEEFQAEGFYGQSWYKLFGSLDRCSELMLKPITLQVQKWLLDFPDLAIHPSMLWGCPPPPPVPVLRAGAGRVSSAASQGTCSWPVSTCKG